MSILGGIFGHVGRVSKDEIKESLYDARSRMQHVIRSIEIAEGEIDDGKNGCREALDTMQYSRDDFDTAIREYGRAVQMLRRAQGNCPECGSSYCE